jgi:predicted dehydrogenase
MSNTHSSTTLRWGLVGYGSLADKRLAAALREASGSALSGVWGRDFGKTQEFASRHNIPHAHDSLESLLRSDIDAVYVCTPPDSHAEYTLPAIAAGKHVLVEKPMAANVADCESMVDAAQKQGVTLGVAYYRRAYPKMQHIKQLIDEGVLGVPTWVNIAAHSWFDPQPGDTTYWRVQKARSGGGGAVADIGVHRLDLLQYWLGPCQMKYSHLQHMAHSYEVEDGSSTMLELANGAPVHAYFSWNSKTWQDRFEIVGTEGKIIAEPLDGAPLTVFRGRDREELQIEPPANAHLPCVEDFVQAVQEKRAPLCDGAAGLETNRLLAAIVS